MKKIFSIGLAAVLVLAAVSAAMAWGPGGWGGGPGWCGGPGAMWGYDGDNSSYSQVDDQKFDKFRTDTAQLRQKMFRLRDELHSLRSAEKPDWDTIANKQKEMVDVRTQMQKKAFEAGIDRPGSGPGCGSGPCGGNGPRHCRGGSR